MRFEQMPDILPGQRLWMAASGGYSFCISEELQGDDLSWTGFMASWKNKQADMKPFGKQRANLIDGGPWKTFREAEQACVATLKQLRAKQ